MSRLHDFGNLRNLERIRKIVEERDALRIEVAALRKGFERRGFGRVGSHRHSVSAGGKVTPGSTGRHVHKVFVTSLHVAMWAMLAYAIAEPIKALISAV